MVIDKFKQIMKDKALDQRIFKQLDSDQFDDGFLTTNYEIYRQDVIDLIVELSQGANVDFDELNATMRDWR